MEQVVSMLPLTGQAAAFRRDGVIVLRGVFAPWVETLRAGIDRLMADPSPLERSYQPWDQPLSFRICATGGGFPNSVILSRTPPWAGSRVNCWARMRCVFFTIMCWSRNRAPRSSPPGIRMVPITAPVARRPSVSGFRWTPCPPRTRWNAWPVPINGGVTTGPCALMARRSMRSMTARPCPISIRAGGILHPELGHGTGGRRGVRFRHRPWRGGDGGSDPPAARLLRALVGDDAVFVSRGGKGSPPFAHLALQDGDPLAGADFPLLYTEPT